MKTITYLATNQTNGKWYVGSTVRDLKRRKNEHEWSNSKDAFHRSLRNNPNKFVWEVLSEVEGLDRSHEQDILNVFYGSEFCYNLSSEAVGFCPEVLKKANKKIHAKKTKDGKSDHAVKAGNASKKSSGGIFSDDFRFSKENKEKSVRGGKAGAQRLIELRVNWKPVECVETGVVYPSAKVAETETGACASHIGKVLKGVRKSAGGLHWRRPNEQ